MNNRPVLDLGVLPREKRKALAKTYDLLAFDALLPFPNLVRDGTRQRIDEAFAEVLDLPDISVLRQLLPREFFIGSSICRYITPSSLN